tara:strand:- start:238 stop:612 length:375 start_codon:yes stop_codon:yes gene_type:complete
MQNQNQNQKDIFTEITNRKDLLDNILPHNPGYVIVKFGAEWCKPCKKIKETVDTSFSKMGPNVQCFDIDIDECFDVYAFMKSRKMVVGIPSILVWNRGNKEFVPSAFISSSDNVEVENFLSNYI